MQTNIITKKTVCFTETDREKLYADIYSPVKDTKRSPLILMIHGGAWKFGTKDMNTEWGELLAQNGYTVMSMDYRLSAPGYTTWPGVLDDVKASLSYMIEHADEYNIDTERIAVAGDSAGAHLSLHLSLQEEFSNIIKSAVLVYGVYDLKSWREFTLQTREDDPVAELLGVEPDEAPDVYVEASPLFKLEEALKNKKDINQNYFIIWGNDDKIVPHAQTLDLIELLEEHDISPTVFEADGYGHHWFNIFGDVGKHIYEEPSKTLVPELLEYLEKNL